MEERTPEGPTPIYLEETVHEHMTTAIRLERQARELKAKGRKYEASIAVSDAQDAWNRMHAAMDVLAKLNPNVVC